MSPCMNAFSPSANVPSEVVEARICRVTLEDQSLSPSLVALFFSDHVRLRGIYVRHRLEIEHSLPFGFECFRKLRSLLGRKMVLPYFVGVPSTEKKFSMQGARFG